MSKDDPRETWKERDEAEINAAVEHLTGSREGRRFLWWLLQIGKVGGQPFTGEALGTAFNAGELNIGNQILDRITRVTPEGYLAMMKEQADEHRNRDLVLRDFARGGDDGRNFDDDDGNG